MLPQNSLAELLQHLQNNPSSIPFADMSQGEGGALLAALARRREAEQQAMAGFPSMNPNPPEMAGLRPVGRFEAADNPQLQMARENTPEARRARELVQLEQRRSEMRAGQNRSGTKYVPGAKVGKSVVGRMGDGPIALQGTLTPEEMAAALQGRQNLRAAAKAFRDERKTRIAERKSAQPTTEPAGVDRLVQQAMSQGATFAEAMQLAMANRQEDRLQRDSDLRATLAGREADQANSDLSYKQQLLAAEQSQRIVPAIKQMIPGTDMTLEKALRPGTLTAIMTPDGQIDRQRLNDIYQQGLLTPQELGRLKEAGFRPERTSWQRMSGSYPTAGEYSPPGRPATNMPTTWPNPEYMQ